MTGRTYAQEAAALLLIGTVAQFGWHHAPAEAQADVWNASQALLILLLLGLCANAYRSRWMAAAALLVGVWQGMTAACSLTYLAAPWHVEPGQAQCSAALNFPLGAVGLWLALLLIALIAQRGHQAGGGHGTE